MSILAATRSVSLLGASFRPTPPRLSPPQLDLSSPPPALLVTDTGSSSTRSPLVELILESPVINASLDKSVVRSISKQRSRARCYVIDAVQDSAISDTEETPNEVHMQANQKQNRSVKPKRRPVPTTATEAGTVSTVLTAPPPPPNVQWVGSIHVSSSLVHVPCITDVFSVQHEASWQVSPAPSRVFDPVYGSKYSFLFATHHETARCAFVVTGTFHSHHPLPFPIGRMLTLSLACMSSCESDRTVMPTLP